jgi:beta-lactamase superfamily II metal-dependent hydrolase
MPNNTRFAGYPDAVIYEEPDGTNRRGKKPLQHLIWGDWLRLEGSKKGNFLKVHARGVDGWVHKDDIQKERLMEVTFVDIGQGDGCLVVNSDDKHMVIDAGEGDNMYRYLSWRYGGFEKPWTFESAVISHPDADHYGGFEEILDEKNVKFKTIYHNGIVERKAKKRLDSLGPRKSSGSRSYLTGLIPTKADLTSFLSVSSRWKGKKYPTMLERGLNKYSKFEMLSTQQGYMPGYGPNKDLTIEVLGPVVEPGPNNNPRLRLLGNVGKTKNGHSVVLRARYHNVSFLLGGDLNIPAEKFLLSHHTPGFNSFPRSEKKRKELIEEARKVFQVDIAKSCHHGSADFSSLFLSALYPIATVISSGDNEPHSHPRADALGSIGLHSRGTRPLIFSTELARSAKELIKHPHVLRKELDRLNKEIDNAPEKTAKERKKKAQLENKRNKLLNKTIARSIAVFGAIHARTDGQNVVIAQKIERPRGKNKKWDIYCLEPDSSGSLHYISKH